MGMKNIELGRGFTPMYVTLVFNRKGYEKAAKRYPDRLPFEQLEQFAACCAFFEAQKGFAPFCLVYVSPRFTADNVNSVALLAHEFIHCKQHCERVMGTTMDHETEAYYVQNLLLYALPKLKRAVKRK